MEENLENLLIDNQQTEKEIAFERENNDIIVQTLEDEKNSQSVSLYPFLQTLQQVKNEEYLQSKKEKNSAIFATTTYIRWLLTDGLFCAPFYFKTFGISMCFCLYVLSFFLNTASYNYISNASFETKSDHYPEVVEKILGKKYAKIFTLAYFFNLANSFLSSTLLSWTLLKFILKTASLDNKEWYSDPYNSEINEYNLQVIAIRAIFYTLFVICAIPVLLKKTIRDFNFLMRIYIYSLFFVLGCFFVQMPTYFKKISSTNEHYVNYFVTSPSLVWVESWNNVLISFCTQAFFLNLKSEMINPSRKTMFRMPIIGNLIVFCVNIFIGMICYMSLGSLHTPFTLFDKLPIPEVKHLDFFLLISVITILFTVCATTAFYNVVLRPLLADVFKLDIENRRTFVWISILPFVIFVVLSIVAPWLYRYLGLFSNCFLMFVCYFTPAMMQRKMDQKKGIMRSRFGPLNMFLSFIAINAVCSQVLSIYRFS